MSAAGTSVHALAARLGVSRAAVQKAAARGRLAGAVVRKKGRLVVLDAALAKKLWAQQRTRVAPARPKPSAAKTRRARPEAEQAPAPPAAAVPVTPAPPIAGSLVDAQIRLSLARAKAQEMASAIKSGGLVELRTAERRGFEAARVVRDSILNIPDRIAAELAGESDPARVHARLTAELHQALEMIAATLEGAAAAVA